MTDWWEHELAKTRSLFGADVTRALLDEAIELSRTSVHSTADHFKDLVYKRCLQENKAAFREIAPLKPGPITR